MKALSLFGATTALCALSFSAAMAQDTFQDTHADVLAAALQEGTLTVYSTLNEDTMRITAEGFMRAFPGIEVKALRLTSVPLYARLTSEFEAGIYDADVVGTAEVRTFTEHPEWWHPMTSDLVWTLNELPEQAKGDNWLAATQSTNSIAYNTDVFTEETAPKTWEDLLLPELKGRGIFVDPRASVPHQTWLKYLEEEYGEEYLVALGQQDFTLAASAAPAAQEVAAGGADFAFPVSEGHMALLAEKGAPIALLHPWEHSDFPATGSQQHWGISARTSHPNAARLWVSWLLTKDGAQLNCGGTNIALVLRTEEDRGPCLAYIENLILPEQLSPEENARRAALAGLN